MMDITCCIDSNYAKYCYVMLTSLLENNKGEQISVHPKIRKQSQWQSQLQ